MFTLKLLQSHFEMMKRRVKLKTQYRLDKSKLHENQLTRII